MTKLSLLAVSGMTLLASGVVCAQAYPSRPVRIVIAAGVGTPDDFNVRLIAPKLGELLGQQFVADNRPGAAGLIGQTFAANAPPDGYTLLFAGGSITGSKYVNANFRFDVLRDFTPVSLIALGKFVLVTHPNVPAQNVKELIALARSRAGKLTYATTGPGQTPFWNALMFNHMAGIKAVEIPYKNSSESMIDVIAGRVDYYFSGSVAAVTNRAKLRVLAVTSATRSSAFPGVPTIAEAALPGYDMPSWGSLIGPAGIPREIVNALNAAVVRTLGMPDVRERFLTVGTEPAPSTPEGLSKQFADWVDRYGKLAKLAGIKPQ